VSVGSGPDQEKQAPAEVVAPSAEATAPLWSVAAWKTRLVNLVTQPGLWGRVAAVVVALIIAAPVFVATGAAPGEAYSALWEGSFGSLRAFGDVLNRADTFLLLGLGIAIAIRAGFFNVGAEGQLWVGALGGTLVAIYLSGPAALIIPLALVAGFVFGALWSLLVALLKIFFQVDELISSLMLNYVAILLIGYLTFGPIQAYRAGQTERIPTEYYLPTLIPDTRVHVGFLIGLAAVVGLWLLLYRTTFGYEIRTVGGNPDAARYAGISANKVIVRVSLIGGGLCGVAGANAILGVQHVLLSTFSTGFGYTAIAVALLGGLGPFGVLAAAVLFGALEIGASNMQYVADVPAALSGLIEGMILVLFLIGISVPAVRRRLGALRLRRTRHAEGG
jgi:general nucleoside transport system permease protein